MGHFIHFIRTLTVVLGFCFTCGIACNPRQQDVATVKTLPNDAFLDIYHDTDSTSYYPALISKITSFNLEFSADHSALELEWPIDDIKRSLLTRFGTPTIAALSADTASIAYMHDALDIERSSVNIADSVHAPVDGMALVFYDGGDTDPYSTAVIIYDAASRLVISLLHVNPVAHLSPDHLTPVKRGDHIGNLAPVASMKPAYENEHRHTHLSVLDVEKSEVLDPARFFSSYLDTVGPSIKGVYVLSDDTKRHTVLVDGKLDLVVEAYDRDGQNDRNFEIAELGYRVSDQDGNMILEMRRCSFERLTSSLSDNDIRPLLDLGNAGNEQLTDSWEDMRSDADNKHRTFRYALTNIKEKNGYCELLSDENGYIAVDQGIETLNLQVELYDLKGNKTEATLKISR